ncbi:CHAT domain-containing protein [Tolypothrix sp. FACHB-123]|uniref:CHAT domain-containing protein n=1 Tax=Tolypothrix sp. FACHB-123 TaxID=2692868 RepID=UPI0016826E45|nr:CHAT domain-containing tetratricopeptide repeat protein [Tolypothrix sp. FACHB-123]MBD2356490.1 CHAT domain-containing protein [Tolypothrix sp. FACHB-123]
MRHKLDLDKNRENRLSILFYQVVVAIALLSLAFPPSVALSQVKQTGNRRTDKLTAQAQTREQRQKEAITLSKQGFELYSRSQYRQALELYEQALVICREIGEKTGESVILNNIGAAYDSLGDYQKALVYYQQALVIAQKIGDKAAEGNRFNNIGLVYKKMGQYQQALNYYQKALEIAKVTGNKAAEAVIIDNIANIYHSLGQYQKTLDYRQQALAIFRQIGALANESTVLNNLGGFYLDRGDYQQALDYYHQALTISQKIGNKNSEGITLDNIGAIYMKLREYKKSLEYSQKALLIFQQIGAKEDEAITLNNMGYSYIAYGNYSEAEKSLIAAIDILDSLRTKLTDDQKISIFEQQAKTYLFLQIALISQNKIAQALEISERGRARAFIDLLESRSNNSPKNTTLKPSNPSIAQLKQIAQKQKATFVEYSIIDDSQIYIWVVKPTGDIAFQKVDLTSIKTPLRKLVESSRESIGVVGRGIRVDYKGGTKQAEKLKQLHQLLIAPIAKHLPNNPDERVIFIPHESLFLVPFPALQDANDKYLIEKHTILTAPAIQVLEYTNKQNNQALKTKSLSTDNALIIGNPIMPFIGIPPKQLIPLPGAEQEAQSIAKLLNTQPLIGKQATKSTVLEKIQNAKIIHFATHGLLDGFGERVPGAIALSPDSPPSAKQANEGLLKTTEIIDLKLNADLVVLSACDTGRGEITGDGVVGLSRSLLTAGAKSVVVSLWSVPDNSTAELMVEFYQQLQQNPDKAKALRQAMLKTMKKHDHPIHWAAFTLVGESE